MDRSSTKKRFPDLDLSKNQSRLFLIWTLDIEGRSLRMIQAWASSAIGDCLLRELIDDGNCCCLVKLRLLYHSIDALLRLGSEKNKIKTNYGVQTRSLDSDARNICDISQDFLLKATHQQKSEFILSRIEELYDCSQSPYHWLYLNSQDDRVSPSRAPPSTPANPSVVENDSSARPMRSLAASHPDEDDWIVVSPRLESGKATGNCERASAPDSNSLCIGRDELL